MYLTEDMELPETLAPRGTRPPGRRGGRAARGPGGGKKIY